MKLRIIKRHNEYCPQFRFFGFWCYFNELNSNHQVIRNTLKQTEEWINNYINKINPIYIVIKEYKVIEAAR
jgi:hypothetical protein